jgi:hypothetical protein
VLTHPGFHSKLTESSNTVLGPFPSATKINTRIIFSGPLEQMMLSGNREHVENRLLAASSRNPGWGILNFIDIKDWSNLTTTIENDRELANSLFNKDDEPYSDNQALFVHRSKVLNGIDKVHST